jgi:integrase/recombinase XerD
MKSFRWERYPQLVREETAYKWLTIQSNLGLAFNTLNAYAYNLEKFLNFCALHSIVVKEAKREHVALYVHDMADRQNRRTGGAGLSNATMQQHLTTLRLYYDYLIEEGLREKNPVGRGYFVAGRAFAGARDRGLIPHFKQLPWIPTDAEWLAILLAAQTEPMRNRLMLALAYDGGLRREELCSLATGDIDPGHRLLHIRAETTKTRRTRVVPYSPATAELLAGYLVERRVLSRQRGPLFLSDSNRNRAQPITVSTWSKVVRAIALRAKVPRFSTHTPRHLCLTDLARAQWDLHEIAQFAGHATTQTALIYIHLSGRELAQKLADGMASVHDWHIQLLGEILG